MPSYPALPISVDGYSIKPDEGTQASRASDGTLRRRRLYAETIYAVQLTHPLLTAAEFAELEAFYLANRNGFVTWTDPLTARVYTLAMLGPPEHTSVKGAVYLDTQMMLEGTRAI